MSNLTIKGKTELFGIEVPQIYGGFGSDQKVMLAKTIAEIHGRELFKINELINNNRERFRDGEHVVDLKNSILSKDALLKAGIMSKQSIANSTNIYLLSQRGYVRLLKIMDDDVAWEKWDVIEQDYFEMKEQQTLPALTQAQIIAAVAQQAADQEQKILKLSDEVKGIRDVVALNPHDWRKDSSALLSKMALKLGGYEHLKDIRAESYKLLDERFGVDLQCRLTNKRRRMADEGVCKSKRDKLNQLDVIGDDKKLIEGYVAIVKEMAIKYGA